jgi:hypothetical protein
VGKTNRLAIPQRANEIRGWCENILSRKSIFICLNPWQRYVLLPGTRDDGHEQLSFKAIPKMVQKKGRVVTVYGMKNLTQNVKPTPG